MTPRDEFRTAVFKRDNNLCVICKGPAKDAHHIIERRLFPDGGYYLDNGASLCEIDHIRAEQTVLTCEEIRQAAGISQVILPPHLYADERYDKWGNPYLGNHRRIRGELFYDESVQKILAPVLGEFTKYVKYPRTWHLPWSPGTTKDDRVIENAERQFGGKDVVVTVKMDGENTTMYDDYMHTRSVDSRSDETISWMRNYHAKHGWQIPDGWRVCGENLYTKHQIHYAKLPNYFMMFSIWNEANVCLSWADTKDWATLLGFGIVPILYEGPYSEKVIRELYSATYENDEMEGYVVRSVSSFSYGEFKNNVAKFVRAGHSAGAHGRRKGPIVLNQLR